MTSGHMPNVFVYVLDGEGCLILMCLREGD